MKSFDQTVIDFVNERGEQTVSEVLAGIGHTIAAARAANMANKRKSNKSVHPKTIAQARRRIVTNALSKLYRQGKLRRVALGTYAPLLPKIAEITKTA